MLFGTVSLLVQKYSCLENVLEHAKQAKEAEDKFPISAGREELDSEYLLGLKFWI